MKAGIIIIGDEILNGTTLDTNSAFMAGVLVSNGIQVSEINVVPDNHDAIVSALDRFCSKYRLVITSGGLGPTNDDMTRDAVVSYFKTELVFNEDVYKTVSERLARRKMQVNEINRAQALVPLKSDIIQNPVGTAPVFWTAYDNGVCINLPGVPSEMKFLLEHVLISRIRETFQVDSIVRKDIHLVGIAESTLAEKLKEVEAEIIEACNKNEQYKLAYLPSRGLLKLQLTGKGKDESDLSHQLESFTEKIKAVAGEFIFGYDHDVFASYIGRLLKDRDATICTAESCTGGYLAHQITSVTGSADYYQGTIVSYSYEVKKRELGVQQETLDRHGAVSKETLEEMLEGALKKFGTTYALATTGIAGPTGGGEEKPVGTVWIGVASKYKMETKLYRFDHGRLDNIHLFSITALDMLRRFILGYKI